MFSSIFHYDNPFWRFMGKLGDLIILNILWVICSIPLITIGASTTAVYYVTLKLVKDEEGATIRSFFKSFKDNFKQSTVIWIIMFIVGMILSIDLRFVIDLNPTESILRTVLMAVFGCFGLMYLAVFVYIFAIQAKFYNSIRRTFVNACFMAIRHFPKTCLIIMTDAAILILCTVLMPQLFIVIILFGIPLFAFINSYLLTGIFKNYMSEEEVPDMLG